MLKHRTKWFQIESMWTQVTVLVVRIMAIYIYIYMHALIMDSQGYLILIKMENKGIS